MNPSSSNKPATDDTPNVTNMLARLAVETPDRRAIVFGDVSMSWRELHLRSNQIANQLRDSGLARGARVAICARNTPDYIPTLLGVVKAACSVVPLPTMVSTDTLGAMISDSKACVLFSDKAMAQNAEVALAEHSNCAITQKISFDFNARQWHNLQEWIDGADISDPIEQPGPDDEFNVIYSSGTTGRPKGIIHTHAFRSGDADELKTLGFPERGVTIITTSLYSNWSVYAFLATLQSGGESIIMPKFDVAAFLSLCEREQPSNVFLVPVQCQRILNDPSFSARRLGNKTSKWVAGSPLPIEVKQELLRRWPGGLNEIYGMTEGAPSTTLQAHLYPDKLSSVGRPGIGTCLKILDEAESEVQPGEVGEIIGHGPSMMKGYNDLPEETKSLHWHDKDGRLFFRSGDLGHLDEDGFLHISGRKKDMIISGGFNVYPDDLEALLLRHPDVEEAAVIGALSHKWGETPLAIIVLRDGTTIAAETLRNWANNRLGKVQRIARIIFQENLPRGNLGKVLKTDLREKFGREPID